MWTSLTPRRRGAVLITLWCAGVIALAVGPPGLAGDVLRSTRPAESRGAVAGEGVAGGRAAQTGAAARTPSEAGGGTGTAAATASGGGTAPAGAGTGTGGANGTGSGDVAGITVRSPDALLTADDGAGRAPVLAVTQATPGTVGGVPLRIRNDGGRAARVELVRTSLVDTPGPLGGVLSASLRLDLLPDRGPVLAAGPLAGVSRITLGEIAPGSSRTWTMRLTFPDGGTPAGPAAGDNRLQGARVLAGYELRELR